MAYCFFDRIEDFLLEHQGYVLRSSPPITNLPYYPQIQPQNNTLRKCPAFTAARILQNWLRQYFSAAFHGKKKMGWKFVVRREANYQTKRMCLNGILLTGQIQVL